MSDELAKLSNKQVADFYMRLANHVDSIKGSVPVSLAAMLMRQWLKNRNPNFTYLIDAPDHLKYYSGTLDVLRYHRNVFLTIEKGKITGKLPTWLGIIPRIQGKPPYTPKWNKVSPLSLEYESLVEASVLKQLTGSNEEIDLIYSLHGFHVKSYAIVTGVAIPNSNKLRIIFVNYEAEVFDYYHWDPSKHITVPNPDHGKNFSGAVTPKSYSVVVYHSNAKRLEDAGLAAPYNVLTKRWRVTDPAVVHAADIDPDKSI
ncbi:MAG: hypothetical protein HY080_13635 [Gammaproteobacteria bacterium]|nr:hypothetical protein [Gammaproteobacteria bacterium]